MNCPECKEDFVKRSKGQGARKFCEKCRPPVSAFQFTQKEARRYCQLDGCRRQIPDTKGLNAKYCTTKHSQAAGQRAYQSRQDAKKKANDLFKNANTNEVIKQERQGEIYDWLDANPDIKKQLLDGEITASSVAVMKGWTTAGVTRAMQAHLTQMAIDQQRDKWKRDPQVDAMLPVEQMQLLKTVEPDGEEFNLLLDHVVRAYSVFSRRFFRLEGKRPLIMPFHKKWIRSIIRTWAVGGKQLILSPPRHGKSEMLIRFVVWFIIMDPNIRIGWFCASRDVAELMLGAVKDHLENNEPLIKATLPPGELYNPGLKSGNPWSAKEIKVAQQSWVGAKSSSLLALGLTSKFLSRDMDLIVIDDPEDFDSTQEPGQRKKARHKLAEIGTRKEEHTAEVFISSRQHPDDIPAHLLALEGGRQSWNAIVDSAHDPSCPEDPDDWDAHADCVLFPEVRTYKWLMEKKEEMEVLGVPHAFSMRYLNLPIPEEGQVFDVKLIREVALNRNRGIGLDGLPLGHLAAGLDPSARGIQASFLWHYRADDEDATKVKMSMVDLDGQKAGGVQGAIDIICDWHDIYGVALWYYEVNSQQIEFYKLVKEGVRKRMTALLGYNPIIIKEHSTGKNKQDAELGISSMAPLYHGGMIDLPYGDHKSRVKVNMLLRQLELWTSDGVQSKRALTDIKMAQWFPFVGKIQSFMRNIKKPKTTLAKEASYPNYDGNEAAWGGSSYPGG